MDWKKYAWVRRGKRRQETLKVFDMAKTPLTVNDVHSKSRIAISQASKTVAELQEAELIRCLNPDDKIGRLYMITEAGKEIIKKMEDSRID